jgi:transglutaminase-like putative cysteine protease
VEIAPQPAVIDEYEDYFGNRVLYFAIQEEHEQLDVQIISRISLNAPAAGTDELYAQMPWEQIKKDLQEPGATNLDARQFVPATDMTPASPGIEDFARQSFTPGRPMLEALWHLTSRIFHEFRFRPGFTTIATPISEVLRERQGVCQDFAHLAIACLRSLGLPARYVSGYIETLPPPGKEKLKGVDASHAWFSAYLPYAGWVDFDPTNNQRPGHQHITIGWGRDYADVPPMKGVILSSGSHTLDVSVDVRRD